MLHENRCYAFTKKAIFPIKKYLPSYLAALKTAEGVFSIEFSEQYNISIFLEILHLIVFHFSVHYQRSSLFLIKN